MEEVIKLLLENGWEEDGTTMAQSFRTHSFAFGGGPIARVGGRIRLKKGDNKVTVGKRTTCFFRKPENPKTVPGQGRMAGRTMYTFNDWPMTNISTKDIEQIKEYIKKQEE